MNRFVLATVLSALLLTGCAAQGGGTAAPTPTPSAGLLLAEYGLAGKSTVEVIDHLDRLGGQERPADLKASVRPHQLVISRGTEEFSLDIPGDRFYLSVAPYQDQTHECFYHSLTTCKGELAAKDVQVKIVDETNGKVLVDQTQTTFANGFVGFWLPRDIKGTLRIAYDGKAGETKISTGQDAATCLTTLQLT